MLCFCVLQFATNSALAASFDCRKATTFVENAICADEVLSYKDEVLGLTYQRALRALADPAPERAAQREWLRGRNGCKDVDCIRRAYAERLGVLERREAQSDVLPGTVFHAPDDEVVGVEYARFNQFWTEWAGDWLKQCSAEKDFSDACTAKGVTAPRRAWRQCLEGAQPLRGAARGRAVTACLATQPKSPAPGAWFHGTWQPANKAYEDSGQLFFGADTMTWSTCRRTPYRMERTESDKVILRFEPAAACAVQAMVLKRSGCSLELVYFGEAKDRYPDEHGPVFPGVNCK